MQLLAQTFEAFKTKLSYLEQNELSKNFGEALDRLHQFVQDNFGFSAARPAVLSWLKPVMLLERETRLLAGWQQRHSVSA